MNTAAMACYLLLWQEPTDRALAGWCHDLGCRYWNDEPGSEFHMDNETKLRLLRSELYQ